MITGMHAIVFSPEAEKVRAFFSDVLGMPSADAGGGWHIFALPPAELAVHPADGAARHELYLMCDDIQATLADLRAKGVEVARDVSDQGWGFSRRSACRMVLSSPSTSQGTRHPLGPDQPIVGQKRSQADQGTWCDGHFPCPGTKQRLESEPGLIVGQPRRNAPFLTHDDQWIPYGGISCACGR
jgi:catechol 2,3-dioxygenase-like lactoylglutathione lyase family enzyme